MPLLEQETPAPAVTLDEVRAWLRIGAGGEDILLARLVRSATQLCEQFIGQALVVRGVAEVIPVSRAWRRLGVTPVRSIDAVLAMPDEGAALALALGAYAIDIDANGDGWVRVMQPVPGERVRVEMTAGMATDADGVPEAIRQGIIRLVAELYAQRDVGDAVLPAAVTALWRPWRRMVLA